MKNEDEFDYREKLRLKSSLGFLDYQVSNASAKSNDFSVEPSLTSAVISIEVFLVETELELAEN